MNEDEHSKDGRGLHLGAVCAFLDEKTLPAPSTLIKVNCNLWYFFVVQFPWQLLH